MGRGIARIRWRSKPKKLPSPEYEPIKAWVTVVGELVPKEVVNEIDLTMQQARKLGFSETLLGAIQQAHLRISVMPKL
jgi:hypothetical protein